MKRIRYYSGDLSRPFWRRVKRLGDTPAHEAVYALGVVLQEVEHKVMLALENAEVESRSKWRRDEQEG